MADLMELAERVEALSGPDREIDALIAVAISSWPSARVIWHKGKRRFCRSGEGRIPFPVAGGSGTNWGISFQQINYTASLDAAMTLVPEGCGWLAGYGQTHPDEPMGGALITRNARFVGYGENYDEIAVGEAATPALALCAAALRARASNG